MICTIEKERYKYKQAFEIVKDAEKFGIENFYKNCSKPIDLNSSDILVRCYQWLEKKLYYNITDRWIIDVGCGLGPFVIRMEAKGNVVFGIDFYKSKIGFAQKIKDQYPNKRFWFYEGTTYHTPFYSKWFDFCHSCMVIEHLHDPVSGFAEMCRLAPVVTGIIHMGLYPKESPYHQYFYTPEKVKILLDYFFASYDVCWIDEKICAVFIGQPKKKELNKIEYVPIEKIDCLELNKNRPYMDDIALVNDYVKCLELGGVIELFENPILPIQVHRLENGRFGLAGDGIHRINALKKYKKIELVRCVVIDK